jgi:hypothetical protein
VQNPTSGNLPVTWLVPGPGYQPAGWQGPAQHTWTLACAGFHPPGACKNEAPVGVITQPED